MFKAGPATTSFVRRYILHEEIGMGGMGAVYQATDQLTGAMVALKRLRLYDLLSVTAHRNNASLPVQMMREFQLLSALKHPNIVEVLDFGFEPDGAPYFTMTLLDKPTTIIDAGVGQNLRTQVDLLIQVLRALSYLHRHEIVHRDLKPSNILVSGGQVTLVDFSLSAYDVEAEPPAGTLAYVAPEILSNQPATAASDIFALGIIAYELLVGRYPFQLNDVSALINDILKTHPDFSMLIKDPTLTLKLEKDENGNFLYPTLDELSLNQVSSQLVPVVLKMLHKDPSQRFSDANEVITALSHAIGQSLETDTPKTQSSKLEHASFIGRYQEMDRLVEAIRQVCAADHSYGSAWLIGGDEGIGKTRLLEMLRPVAQINGATVLVGHARHQQTRLFHMWREVLLPLVVTNQVTSEEAVMLQAIIPAIGDHVDVRIEPLQHMDTEVFEKQMVETIGSIFKRHTQPIVIFLEDVHWARPESLRLLAYLLHNIHDSRMMIVATFCHAKLPDSGAHLSTLYAFVQENTIILNNLSRSEVSDLVYAMLGTAGTDPVIQDYLWEQSGGNPRRLIVAIQSLAQRAGDLDAIDRFLIEES